MDRPGAQDRVVGTSPAGSPWAGPYSVETGPPFAATAPISAWPFSWNASLSPVGDHARASMSVPVASRCNPVPAVVITSMAEPVLNAIRLPSGDHATAPGLTVGQP